METGWDTEIAALLNDLLVVQDDLLALLEDKRRLLAAADVAGMVHMAPREQALIERLQACHDRRARLLRSAVDQGLPGKNIRSLADVLAGPARKAVRARIDEASHRSRLLRHHSLTNWVLAQRTLLHLSQLLEIIATRGRRHPTYEKGAVSGPTGSLVDQAV